MQGLTKIIPNIQNESLIRCLEMTTFTVCLKTFKHLKEKFKLCYFF